MNDADKPSATVEEALERLSETANDSIDQLSSRITQLTKQRDDLLVALEDVLTAIDKCGFAACPDSFALMRTLARARGVMLRAETLP